MPETYWTVRWPDGVEETLYSPSSVITEHFTPGESYAPDHFLARARTALTLASDRVAAKYGFACTSAQAQLSAIETRIQQLEGGDQTRIACLRISQ